MNHTHLYFVKTQSQFSKIEVLFGGLFFSYLVLTVSMKLSFGVIGSRISGPIQLTRFAVSYFSNASTVGYISLNSMTHSFFLSSLIEKSKSERQKSLPIALRESMVKCIPSCLPSVGPQTEHSRVQEFKMSNYWRMVTRPVVPLESATSNLQLS